MDAQNTRPEQPRVPLNPDWRYVPIGGRECGRIEARLPTDYGLARVTIARGVPRLSGSLIAEAPAMERLLRQLYEWHDCGRLPITLRWISDDAPNLSKGYYHFLGEMCRCEFGRKCREIFARIEAGCNPWPNTEDRK